MTTTTAILAVCVLAGHPAAGMIPLAARMLAGRLARLRNGRKGRNGPFRGPVPALISGDTVPVDLSENNIETI